MINYQQHIINTAKKSGSTGSVIFGSKLVVTWIEIHQEDLMADWALAVVGKKPFPIRGLDQ